MKSFREDPQLSLDYREDPVVERDWKLVLDAVKSATVGLGGVKELAHRADANPTLVSDAIAETDRKRVAAKWLVILLRHAPEDDAVRLLERLCAIRGYTLGKKKSQRTADEKLERVLDLLRSQLGIAGARIAAEVEE